MNLLHQSNLILHHKLHFQNQHRQLFHTKFHHRITILHSSMQLSPILSKNQKQMQLFLLPRINDHQKAKPQTLVLIIINAQTSNAKSQCESIIIHPLYFKCDKTLIQSYKVIVKKCGFLHKKCLIHKTCECNFVVSSITMYSNMWCVFGHILQ